MIFVVLTMNVEFMFKSENDTSLPQGKKITCRTREINSIFNATNIGFFFFNYIFLVLAYKCIFQRLYAVYNTLRNVKFVIVTEYFQCAHHTCEDIALIQ